MLLCRVEPLVHVRANGVSGGEGTEDVAAGVALEAPADLLAGLASPRHHTPTGAPLTTSTLKSRQCAQGWLTENRELEEGNGFHSFGSGFLSTSPPRQRIVYPSSVRS
jgi:hypothetical protein